MGHARICEKQTRGVNKSPKKHTTPIPTGEPEYAKNALKVWTNHRKTLVHQCHAARQNVRKTHQMGEQNAEKNISTQVLWGEPEYAKNALEDRTNLPKTLVHKYHEARKNMRKPHERGEQITEKQWYTISQNMRKTHSNDEQIAEKR